MGKYEPLTAFLSDVRTDEVAMTFSEIEGVLGKPLPASKQYAAWWSNNAANNVMTRAWLAAGFRTESVDVRGGRLVFRRAGPERPSAVSAGKGPGLLKRIQARLGGTVTFLPDVDLTSPTGEVWDAQGS